MVLTTSLFLALRAPESAMRTSPQRGAIVCLFVSPVMGFPSGTLRLLSPPLFI